MLIGTRAKQALRRTAQWEKRVLGASSLFPRSLRRRLSKVMRKTLLPEGRRFLQIDRLAKFFCELEERRACYVVVRWFEDLPEAVDGDIDFIVADEDLHIFEMLLSSDRTGIPCDIYSESGLVGYRYGNLPYYPPKLARDIIRRGVFHRANVRVPCVEDHFFSLAYHCLYHKGLDCGLPTSASRMRPARVPKHDYSGTLSVLAQDLGLNVDINMEALDSLLADRGWRPGEHILGALAIDNVWLQSRAIAQQSGEQLNAIFEGAPEPWCDTHEGQDTSAS